MIIIRQREHHSGVDYALDFKWRKDKWGGFSFPCDKAGKVDESKLNPDALENYRKCLSGEHDVVCEGVVTIPYSYHEPAIGRCSCGKGVILDSFTNTCDGCGADYNSAGQRLAPREQWGEETGEHWAECY